MFNRIYSVYKRRVNIFVVLNIYSHVISPLFHEFVLQATNSELCECAQGIATILEVGVKMCMCVTYHHQNDKYLHYLLLPAESFIEGNMC